VVLIKHLELLVTQVFHAPAVVVDLSMVKTTNQKQVL